MIESSLGYIIARTFPESIIMILSGILLLDKKIESKEVLTKGITLGMIVAFIRMLPIAFGVHTVLGILAFSMILYSISGDDVMSTIVATVGVWISLALSEGIYVMIAIPVFNMDMELITNNQTIISAILTLPSLVIMLGVVVLLKKGLKKLNI